MNFNVIPSDKFKREAKRLIKKFPSLKQELANLNSLLEKEPETGTPLRRFMWSVETPPTADHPGWWGHQPATI